jgi:hypothetical protein
LNVLNPRVSVVSVGVKNTYGHPAAETLQRLGERGSAVERTDLNGTVTITVPLQQPDQIKIESEIGKRLAPARSAIGRRAPSEAAADAVWPIRLTSVGVAGENSGCPIPRASVFILRKQRTSHFAVK